MSEEDRPVPLLVLGLGNLLCADDGLGALAVHLLTQQYRAPEGALVLDGGTLGLSLLPHLEQARDAILVDAIRTDSAPGTFVRLEGDEVAPAVASRLSVHQIGVLDLLEAARWRQRTPQRLVLLGLVPQSLELGLGCTPAVEAAVPGLVRQVVAEAEAFGQRFLPRTRDEAAVPDASSLARVYGL
ncbi:MAG TPA: hydrogenase maturation protease [Vicinamibacteria bacterium]|nr:hydrogenase maturation protease [Vicinamibacteria bacterium]